MKNRRGWANMPKKADSPFSEYTGSDGMHYAHFESGAPAPTNLPHDLWGIVTGEVQPWIEASAEAARFITKKCNGFVAVHPMDGYTVWFFDSLNHARAAKYRITNKGIHCGDNISRFKVGDDGVPKFVGIEN